MAIREACSVCAKQFEVQLRWQMEERSGAFSFFCSRACYEANTTDERGVACDACGKRFVVELVSQVVAAKGTRRYACGLECREQIVREANGARLGDTVYAQDSRQSAVDSRQSETAGASRRGLHANADAHANANADANAHANADANAHANADAHASANADAHANGKARAGAAAVATAAASSGLGALPRRIAVFNHKGGTGKTTTAVSLAAALAAKGQRVLLVDTDAQGNVGASLGIKCERSLYHVLVMGVSPAEAAMPVRTNFDVLGSNETLAAAELYLAGRRERDRVLRDRLASTSQLYDVVILDCSPSLSLMNQNALVFADSLLIPVACDYLSLVGVRQVLRTVKNVNTLLHHPVRIGGVIPTMYDARAKICQDALATLREHFGPRCLPPIRATSKVKEAPANAKTIFEWAGDSNAARDYEAVVDLLIRGVESGEGDKRADAARGTTRLQVA